MEKKKNRTFGLIGLGNFGSSVAENLLRHCKHVIDISEACVASLADTLSQALIVDARDDAALRDAGFGDCDTAVVAMGQHIAQILHNPLMRDYVCLGNGYHVVNFRIPESL